MNVGSKTAKSLSRFLTSDVWPIVIRFSTHPTWMMRANTWASGRNSSVDAPSVNSSRRPSVVVAASNRKLPWVSSHPFGRPVVPLV